MRPNSNLYIDSQIFVANNHFFQNDELFSALTCTYAYTNDGVVVYAAEQAEHRIRSVASD